MRRGARGTRRDGGARARVWSRRSIRVGAFDWSDLVGGLEGWLGGGGENPGAPQWISIPAAWDAGLSRILAFARSDNPVIDGRPPAGAGRSVPGCVDPFAPDEVSRVRGRGWVLVVVVAGAGRCL